MQVEERLPERPSPPSSGLQTAPLHGQYVKCFPEKCSSLSEVAALLPRLLLPPPPPPPSTPPPPHKRLSEARELEEEGRDGFQLALADEGGRRPSVFIIPQPGRCHTSPSSGIHLLPTGDVFTSGDVRRRRHVMRVSDLMRLLLH